MLSNTILSFFSNIIYKIVNVVVFIIINNMYGKISAGIFSLSLTYLLIFSSFSIGFDELLTKEYLSLKDDFRTLIKKFILVKILFSLVSFLLIFLLTNFYFEYNFEIKKMIYWMGACLLFESFLMLAQALLFAMNYFKSPIISYFFIGLVRISGSLLVLKKQLSLDNIGVIWLLGSIVGTLIMIFLLQLKIRKLSVISSKEEISIRNILLKSKPYISLSFLTSIEYQVDVLILSYFKSPYEIGIYSSITTIFSLTGLLGQAFRSAIYPLMVKTGRVSNIALNRIYLNAYKLLWIIVIPISTVIFVLATEIIHFIFGDGFKSAIFPLRIVVWALIPQFLNIANTRYLLSNNRQKLLPMFVFISMTVNIICNVILIPNIGIFGAAVARIASTITYYLLSISVIRQFISKSILELIVVKSIATALLIGIILNYLQNKFQIHFMFLIFLGIMIYTIFTFSFGIIKKEDLKFYLLDIGVGEH